MQDFSFDDTEALFVRINATELSQAEGGYRLQLAEIEVYDDPNAEVPDIPEPEESEEPTPPAEPEEPDAERIVIKAGGLTSRRCIFSRIGTIRAWKAKRYPFTVTVILTRSSSL